MGKIGDVLGTLVVLWFFVSVLQTGYIVYDLYTDKETIQENQELKDKYSKLEKQANKTIEDIVKEANKQIGIANGINKAYDRELKKCLSKIQEI